MKVRSDFVSNSSSSSFVVIRDCGRWICTAEDAGLSEWAGKELVLPNRAIGLSEFGWEIRIYDGIGEKLNWCALCLIEIATLENEIKHRDAEEWIRKNPHAGKSSKYLEMLKRLCNKTYGIDVRLPTLEDEKSDDADRGYIDHQSGPMENPDAASMFASYEALERFVCNTASHIDGGNDNEERG